VGGSGSGSGSGNGIHSTSTEHDDDAMRESVDGDVEFGMNSHKRAIKARPTSIPANGIPLWRRLEAVPSSAAAALALHRSTSRASSEASGGGLDRTTSVGSGIGDADHLPSSSSSSSFSSMNISQAIRTALLSASDVATSFFTSAQVKEFRFKDFCPKLFGKVRELCGIDHEQYAKSFEKTCKEKFSEGRSGAFMFFSSNERCIVKTTTKSESLALHAIMPEYVKHLQANPNSLVCRFLGAHCITMYGNELYFVVMLNVFPTFPLSERYDLKGSWVNRHGFEMSRKSKRERMRREPTASSPLYQDNDLQHRISLEPDVTFALASQIRRDVLFLRSKQRSP
jgi:hypothetical protein